MSVRMSSAEHDAILPVIKECLASPDRMSYEQIGSRIKAATGIEVSMNTIGRIVRKLKGLPPYPSDYRPKNAMPALPATTDCEQLMAENRRMKETIKAILDLLMAEVMQMGKY